MGLMVILTPGLKVKDNGFNTVSAYISWAIHFPSPDTNGGEGDFQESTYRDIQMFIDAVHDAGLWMIARCGAKIIVSLPLLIHATIPQTRSIYKCVSMERTVWTFI